MRDKAHDGKGPLEPGHGGADCRARAWWSISLVGGIVEARKRHVGAAIRGQCARDGAEVETRQQTYGEAPCGAREWVTGGSPARGAFFTRTLDGRNLGGGEGCCQN